MKYTILILLFSVLIGCNDKQEPVSEMSEDEIKKSLSEDEYKKFMKAKSRYQRLDQGGKFDSLDIDQILAEQDSLDKLETNKKQQEQIEYLQKIINRDYQKIEEYEIKIAQGDTADIPGLKEFTKNLKEKVKEKEKRLEKLKN